MIQCIRFENIAGVGIFKNSLTNEIRWDFDHPYHVQIKQLFDRHDAFPTPNEEGLFIRMDNKTYLCAFKTVTQVQQWITSDEILVLLSLGFNIFLLEVSDYQEGDYQIIFDPTSVLSRTNINNLFT